MSWSWKSVSRAFECFFRLFIAIIVTEIARKTGRLFFSVKMVNILEIRPFLTLKGWPTVPKFWPKKVYCAPRHPLKFVSAALIGAEIDGGIICPPPDGVILRPLSSARVKRTEVQFKTNEVKLKTAELHIKINEMCFKTTEERIKITENQFNPRFAGGWR